MVRRVVDADVAADGAAVPHLDVGDRRRDLRRGSAARPRPRTSRSAGRTSPSRRSRAARPRRSRSSRSSSRSARSTSTSGAAARAFITFTSVCPPASGRAPSCAASSETASSTVAGRAYSTSRRSTAVIQSHAAVTCQASALLAGVTIGTLTGSTALITLGPAETTGLSRGGNRYKVACDHNSLPLRRRRVPVRRGPAEEGRQGRP